jgi:hypothetical protein
MLPRVAEMDDLQRSGEGLMGQVPDPEGALADDDLLLRPAPAAAPSFAIERKPNASAPSMAPVQLVAFLSRGGRRWR